MDVGQRLKLTIDDVAFGGDGVARTDAGRVVFVPFAAAGDVLEVEIVAVQATFARGEIHTIESAGPGRCVAPCPHYGRCGGCCYQHLTHETQVATKRLQLEALLRRIGALSALPEVTPVVSSAEPYGYRNKLRVEPLPRAPGQPATDAAAAALDYGFCERDNRTFFALDACPLAPTVLNELLPKAQRTKWARRNATRPQPKPLTLRLAGDGSTHLYFGSAPHTIPWLTETLLGQPVRVPLGAFWQVNPAVAERLVATLAGWFAEAPTPVLVDAYAGVGPFSLAFGPEIERRVLIEADEDALEAARHNHVQWGLGPCQYVRGRTERTLPEILAALDKDGATTTVVLDPPRTGCDPRVVQALKAAKSTRQVLYVSCNAATLARDVRDLCGKGGFALVHLGLFDMFPQTAHFETAALLRR